MTASKTFLIVAVALAAPAVALEDLLPVASAARRATEQFQSGNAVEAGRSLESLYSGGRPSNGVPAVAARESAERSSLLERARHEAREYGSAVAGVVGRLAAGDKETIKDSAKSGGAGMIATAVALAAPLAFAAAGMVLLAGCATDGGLIGHRSGGDIIRDRSGPPYIRPRSGPDYIRPRSGEPIIHHRSGLRADPPPGAY